MQCKLQEGSCCACTPRMHTSLYRERVVALLDISEINIITFAKLVELCRGRILDSHLNNHQVGAAV